MPSLNAFFRSVPEGLLSSLLLSANIDPGPPTHKKGQDWKRAALELLKKTDRNQRSTFEGRADRIGAMCDDSGETAVYSLGLHREQLDALPNRQSRATWLWLNDPIAFQRAEEIRYADEHRRGRQWDAFLSAKDLDLRRDPEALENFRSALREHFDSPNIHLEIFDRVRAGQGNEKYTLIQVTIYREGRADDVLEFVNSALTTRSRRPVYEAALTYEPTTGAIEVVGSERHKRENLARLFCNSLSATELSGERLPLRRFNLQSLRRRQDFSTDAEDQIGSVRVNLLRLMPFDTVGERITLECLRDASKDIWSMSESRFGESDPLSAYRVTQARLNIRFRPNTRSPHGRSLPVTITMPSGSDLKDGSEQERLIGEKYLRRWGLVEDI